MSFIGITYGQMARFWDEFLTAYCGDAEKARRLNALLDPFGQMMYLTSSMAHPLLPEEYRRLYADKIRTQVLARYDEMLGSLAREDLV